MQISISHPGWEFTARLLENGGDGLLSGSEGRLRGTGGNTGVLKEFGALIEDRNMVCECRKGMLYIQGV